MKVKNGFSDPLLFSDMSDRSKASMVWDTFTREALRRFDDHAEIEALETKQLIFVRIAGVNIRLRKADRQSLKIAKNQTQQTVLWTRGRQTVLPGFEDPSIQLFLSYCPDYLWSKLERCVIGLYRDDTPIAYRELDLEDDWELFNINTFGDQGPFAKPLKFKDSVDATELPIEDAEAT